MVFTNGDPSHSLICSAHTHLAVVLWILYIFFFDSEDSSLQCHKHHPQSTWLWIKLASTEVAWPLACKVDTVIKYCWAIYPLWVGTKILKSNGICSWLPLPTMVKKIILLTTDPRWKFKISGTFIIGCRSSLSHCEVQTSQVKSLYISHFSK